MVLSWLSPHLSVRPDRCHRLLPSLTFHATEQRANPSDCRCPSSRWTRAKLRPIPPWRPPPTPRHPSRFPLLWDRACEPWRRSTPMRPPGSHRLLCSPLVGHRPPLIRRPPTLAPPRSAIAPVALESSPPLPWPSRLLPTPLSQTRPRSISSSGTARTSPSGLSTRSTTPRPRSPFPSTTWDRPRCTINHLAAATCEPESCRNSCPPSAAHARLRCTQRRPPRTIITPNSPLRARVTRRRRNLFLSHSIWGYQYLCALIFALLLAFRSDRGERSRTAPVLLFFF